jgi:hypothetical protein
MLSCWDVIDTGAVQFLLLHEGFQFIFVPDILGVIWVASNVS